MTSSSTTQPAKFRQLLVRIGLLAVASTAIALHHNAATEPTIQTPALVAAQSVRASETVTVQEDDPQWDCRTMGNLQCGEGNVIDGRTVPAGDYSHGDQIAAPVGDCLADLGYHAGPVVRADAERCASRKAVASAKQAPAKAKATPDKPAKSKACPAGQHRTRGGDNTCVRGGYYSQTDYDRDGLVDQHQR